MPPIVLAGNKCDLTELRAISYDESIELAKKQDCSIFETSAKEKILNEECFDQVIRLIKKKRQKQQIETQKSLEAPDTCQPINCSIL